MIKETIERVKKPAPKFFKKLRNVGLILGSVSVAILTAPVSLPASVITIAGYLLTASSVLAAFSVLPNVDTNQVKKEAIDNLNKEVKNQGGKLWPGTGGFKLLALLWIGYGFSSPVNAQQNAFHKGINSYNVSDTAFQQNNRAALQALNGNTGNFYFDEVRNKWRIWAGTCPACTVDSAYVDMLNSGGRGSSSLYFKNGLTKRADSITVDLGGTLETDISILQNNPHNTGLELWSNSAALFGGTGGLYTQLQMTDTIFRLQDSRATSKGIQYATDYSANFTTRSLVDKGYVDGLASPSLYFKNGLNKRADSTTVELGGNITKNTILPGVPTGVYNLEFGQSANTLNNLRVYTDNIVNIITTGATGHIGALNTNAGTATISGTGDFGGTSLTASGTGNPPTMTAASTSVNFAGIVYNADYAANFTARSLPDKNYADTRLAGLTFTDSPINGDVPTHNGTNWTFSPAPGAAPGGSNTNIQFNNSSAFGGSDNYTFNDATNIESLNSGTATNNSSPAQIQVRDTNYATVGDYNTLITPSIISTQLTSGGQSAQLFVDPLSTDRAAMQLSWDTPTNHSISIASEDFAGSAVNRILFVGPTTAIQTSATASQNISISATGFISIAPTGNLSLTANVVFNKSINTTAGDGATINLTTGRFRKDTSGSIFTLTNSLITANSVIIMTPANSALDATAINFTVSAGAGSCTITFTAAPTSNYDMNFLVFN